MDNAMGDAIDKTKNAFNKRSKKINDIVRFKRSDLTTLTFSGDEVERFSQPLIRLLYSFKDNRSKTSVGLNNKVFLINASSIDQRISTSGKEVKNKTLDFVKDNISEKTKLDDVKPRIAELDSDKNKFKNYTNGSDPLKSFVQKESGVVITDRLEGMKEINELKDQNDGAKKLLDTPNAYKEQMEQYTDSTYIKEQAKKKAEAMAMEYLNSNPEILKGVQAKMNLLMRKYSIVPNSNDLSTAVKRSSLKGYSFRERLVIAANFQVLTINPFSFDFAPQVGYRFNQKFVLGIGGTYRQAFKDTIATLARQVFGYKAIVSYDILNRCFAYMEYDRNSPGMKREENKSSRIWKDALLIGVGRKFTVHPKLEMTLIMAYNFLYQHNDPIFPQRWVIRLGFQASQFAMLKRRPQF
jgi:hypothetical protein